MTHPESHYDFSLQLSFQLHCRKLRSIFLPILWDFLQIILNLHSWTMGIFLVYNMWHSTLVVAYVLSSFLIPSNFSNRFSFHSKLFDKFDYNYNLVNNSLKSIFNILFINLFKYLITKGHTTYHADRSPGVLHLHSFVKSSVETAAVRTVFI